MRCLWLTRKYPYPANSGELIYSSGLIRTFAGAGADLTVVAHDNDEAGNQIGELTDESGVRWRLGSPDVPGRALSLLTTLPSDSFRLRGGGLLRLFRESLARENWDAVVIDHAAMGWALKPYLVAFPHGRRPRLIYVSHNFEARVRREVASFARESLPWNVALRWDARKYARQERALCRAADLITAITDAEAEAEAEAYRREFPDKPCVTLTPGYEGEKAMDRVISDDTPRRVVMTGSFEWIAKRINLERFLEAAAGPFAEAAIELQIVGKSDDEFRRRITGRFPSVDFVGTVPDTSPYLRGARMGLVVEIVGGGFKLKSLDYIFHGLPIAGLTEAVEGLPLDGPDEILLERFLPNLVREVIEAVDDLDRLNRMRETAYRKCADRFYWEDRGRALFGVIRDLDACGVKSPDRKRRTQPRRRERPVLS